MLRTLGIQFDVEDLLADIWTLAGLSFRSLRVLLLAVSGGARAPPLYRYLDPVRDRDRTANVGAFAAALFELEGAQVAAYLNDAFLSDPDQPLDKLQGIAAAFAKHLVVPPQRHAREADGRNTHDRVSVSEDLEHWSIVDNLILMKISAPVLTSIEKACSQVLAHAMSRVRRSDINLELDRLERLPKGRRYLKIGGFLGALFALSVIAASLGWIAFGVFFLGALILFR